MKTIEQVLDELEDRIKYIMGQIQETDYANDREFALGWDKGFLSALLEFRNWINSD